MDLEKLYPVKEIAAIFKVTEPGVRYWIKKGLKTDTEKIIGRKERIVIKPIDVIEHLGLDKTEYI